MKKVLPNQATELRQDRSAQETQKKVPPLEPAWVGRVLAIIDDSSKRFDKARNKRA